jgi:AhpD family alkylhydroperoxidase
MNKRIFSPESLLRHLREVVIHAAGLPSAFRNQTVDPAFRERILLAVTSVNQCRYCAWMHTDLALSAGMSREEVSALLGQKAEQVPELELTAVRYAVHYAESNARPGKDKTQELYETYGDATAAAIENYIRLIFFANLSGNTFDAFISRLRGKADPESSAIFEAVFASLSAPVFLSMALVGDDTLRVLRA